MRLKKIEGKLAVHITDKSQIDFLVENGLVSDAFKESNAVKEAEWVYFNSNKEIPYDGWMPNYVSTGESVEYWSEKNGFECIEFSDLIIPELTAAEVLDTINEICKNGSCLSCPIEFNSECMIKAGEIDINAVIEVCEKWKSDHEKKEPEVEWVFKCVADAVGLNKIEYLDSVESAIEWCERRTLETGTDHAYVPVCRVKR